MPSWFRRHGSTLSSVSRHVLRDTTTDVLKAHPIQISMLAKGRWMNNVFVKWLWRTVKREDIYLRAYETPAELRAGLDRYFRFYNNRRDHATLGRQTPDEVYFGTISSLPKAA